MNTSLPPAAGGFLVRLPNHENAYPLAAIFLCHGETPQLLTSMSCRTSRSRARSCGRLDLRNRKQTKVGCRSECTYDKDIAMDIAVAKNIDIAIDIDTDTDIGTDIDEDTDTDTDINPDLAIGIRIHTFMKTNIERIANVHMHTHTHVHTCRHTCVCFCHMFVLIPCVVSR